MRELLVAGNWKMHGSTESVAELLTALKGQLPDRAGVALIPPFVYLQQVRQSLAGTAVALGAQNVCEHGPQGAFTGEISAAMLADMGCRYVVVGHSERRSLFAESDEQVARKAQVSLHCGLTPIVCVGETEAEREAGHTLQLIAQQLSAVLDVIPASDFSGSVIAYEPVWAIGTGKTATPEQAQAVHAHIRQLLADRDQTLADRTQVLYGGSVKASNAAELFAQPDIDGGLVGGASLDANEFSAICRAVN